MVEITCCESRLKWIIGEQRDPTLSQRQKRGVSLYYRDKKEQEKSSKRSSKLRGGK